VKNNGQIPFLDLITPHLELEDEFVGVFRAAMRSAGFIGGPMVEEFEREFASVCDARHCVGVGSGTDALRFALIAAGVRTGDSVITVPNTFIATTEAISQAGATPEFVDIDEQSYTMDPAKLRQYLETQCGPDQVTGLPVSRRTGRLVTALVPVHLYGQMADMDPILEIARTYRLVVVEDACQAHGAEYLSRAENRWRKAGSMGTAAAFSFYPGKNLGACGEAGAVTTNNNCLAQTVRMLRDHGQSEKYYHSIEGYNGRLDAIQAGIMTIKLRYLSKWNDSRRLNAARYNELFAPNAETVVLPYESPRSRSVYHLYVIRARDRDHLRAHLADANIGSAIHYPIPLHLQKSYQCLGYRKGDFPIAERMASEILSLPMFPHLTPGQQDQVVNSVSECIQRFGASSYILAPAEQTNAA
jgi:dTDP-4-amino-4,6-dideoxygalactose transaminase